MFASNFPNTILQYIAHHVHVAVEIYERTNKRPTERMSERASEKALIKPSTLIFSRFENWISKISEQKSTLLNFNIQQIPMVSLLILFGHFVPIVHSISLFLSSCLFLFLSPSSISVSISRSVSLPLFSNSIHAAFFRPSLTFCPRFFSGHKHFQNVYLQRSTLKKYARPNENFIMHAATRQMANRHMAIKSLQKTISSQQQVALKKVLFLDISQLEPTFHSGSSFSFYCLVLPHLSIPIFSFSLNVFCRSGLTSWLISFFHALAFIFFTNTRVQHRLASPLVVQNKVVI